MNKNKTKQKQNKNKTKQNKTKQNKTKTKQNKMLIINDTNNENTSKIRATWK